VIAVPPPEGLILYRLVGPTGPVGARDFEPARRIRGNAPQLLRTGISLFMELGQVLRIQRHPGRIAEVTLRGRHRVARTGSSLGHVTVWAPAHELAENVRSVVPSDL
jgi:hypothetical protein